jgi:hypothetical protein
MYKDAIKQLMDDLEDLIFDIEADEDLETNKKHDLLSSLDDAYSALEDVKRLL